MIAGLLNYNYFPFGFFFRPHTRSGTLFIAHLDVKIKTKPVSDLRHPFTQSFICFDLPFTVVNLPELGRRHAGKTFKRPIKCTL